MAKNRRSRQNRPFPTQTSANVPLIDPNRQQKQVQNQQAAVGAKIESMAAQIYTGNLPDLYDIDEETLKKKCKTIVQNSIDAALVFARELWGIDARRAPSKDENQQLMNERQARAPQPIIE